MAVRQVGQAGHSQIGYQRAFVLLTLLTGPSLRLILLPQLSVNRKARLWEIPPLRQDCCYLQTLAEFSERDEFAGALV